MMKIAVASENDMVTEHFGHCANFDIFEVEENQIVKSESIPNPGHKPGFLPNFLNDMGVYVYLCFLYAIRVNIFYNHFPQRKL